MSSKSRGGLSKREYAAKMSGGNLNYKTGRISVPKKSSSSRISSSSSSATYNSNKIKTPYGSFNPNEDMGYIASDQYQSYLNKNQGRPMPTQEFDTINTYVNKKKKEDDNKSGRSAKEAADRQRLQAAAAYSKQAKPVSNLQSGINSFLGIPTANASDGRSISQATGSQSTTNAGWRGALKTGLNIAKNIIPGGGAVSNLASSFGYDLTDALGIPKVQVASPADYSGTSSNPADRLNESLGLSGQPMQDRIASITKHEQDLVKSGMDPNIASIVAGSSKIVNDNGTTGTGTDYSQTSQDRSRTPKPVSNPTPNFLPSPQSSALSSVFNQPEAPDMSPSAQANPFTQRQFLGNGLLSGGAFSNGKGGYGIQGNMGGGSMISDSASLLGVPDEYRQSILDAASASGVNPQLLANLLKQESGFQPQVVSSAGAQGIAQFMPGTARSMGIDPNDPQQAIPAAAKYLRQNYDQFGSWDKALAAYNAGAGNVQKYGGIPPFPETQNYVRNITANLGDLSAPPAQTTPQSNNLSLAEILGIPTAQAAENPQSMGLFGQQPNSIFNQQPKYDYVGSGDYARWMAQLNQGQQAAPQPQHSPQPAPQPAPQAVAVSPYQKFQQDAISGYDSQAKAQKKALNELLKSIKNQYKTAQGEGIANLNKSKQEDLLKLSGLFSFANQSPDSEQRIQYEQRANNDYAGQQADLLRKLSQAQAADISGANQNYQKSIADIMNQKGQAQMNVAQLLFQAQQDALGRKSSVGTSMKAPSHQDIFDWVNGALQAGGSWQEIADQARANGIDTATGSYLDQLLNQANKSNQFRA